MNKIFISYHRHTRSHTEVHHSSEQDEPIEELTVDVLGEVEEPLPCLPICCLLKKNIDISIVFDIFNLSLNRLSYNILISTRYELCHNVMVD